MSKAFESLNFADLSAMKSEITQKMSRLPRDLDKMQDVELTEWGRLTMFQSSISYEISKRIESETNKWMKFKITDDTKEIIRRSSISWLIANIKSEQMKALGMSEEALSDAKETADDLKSGGRPDRANAINRLIRAFLLSLDDVSFPKIDNG